MNKCIKIIELGIVGEFGIDMYILLFLKWITNKDLLYSTGNSTYLILCNNLNGKRTEKRIDTRVCITESLCTPEMNTKLLINYYSNRKV